MCGIQPSGFHHYFACTEVHSSAWVHATWSHLRGKIKNRRTFKSILRSSQPAYPNFARLALVFLSLSRVWIKTFISTIMNTPIADIRFTEIADGAWIRWPSEVPYWVAQDSLIIPTALPFSTACKAILRRHGLVWNNHPFWLGEAFVE